MGVKSLDKNNYGTKATIEGARSIAKRLKSVMRAGGGSTTIVKIRRVVLLLQDKNSKDAGRRYPFAGHLLLLYLTTYCVSKFPGGPFANYECFFSLAHSPFTGMGS